MTEIPLSIDYAPLTEPTEIRILVLLHGVGNDPIQCTLRHSHIYKEEYQTLSYEWGDAGDEDPNITVDGRSVRIRKNLHEAIKQIRDTAEDLHLWIDALCINQANLGEKSQQVGLMGEIFRSAKCVIAWLGVERDDSDVAMELMNRWSRFKRFPLKTSDTEAILALVHRSYWRRVWIIQELHLAPFYVVRRGTQAVHSKQFEYSVANLSVRISGIFSTAVHSHVMRRGFRRMNPLEVWLIICIEGKFESSREHDLIYAVLGVSDDSERIKIVPDYEKPLRDVYLELLTVTNWERYDKSTLLALAEKFGLEMDEGLQRSIAQA